MTAEGSVQWSAMNITPKFKPIWIPQHSSGCYTVTTYHHSPCCWAQTSDRKVLDSVFGGFWLQLFIFSFFGLVLLSDLVPKKKQEFDCMLVSFFVSLNASLFLTSYSGVMIDNRHWNVHHWSNQLATWRIRDVLNKEFNLTAFDRNIRSDLQTSGPFTC